MGRNKLIYALSSAAVVVSSGFDTGGTWAGAIENLRAGWVPLFVRDDQDVPAGNRELIKQGGRSIKLEDLESNLDALFDAPGVAQQASLVREAGASYAADDRAPASSADDATENVQAADLFPSMWPRLAAFLLKPRTEAEVADAFDLQKVQAKAWLQRAIDQGLVRKLSKPTRFERIDAGHDSQASLFEP
jgi:predicted Rossmann fold nucleotide-binding protein DprA/Smf involved in DNA uptake